MAINIEEFKNLVGRGSGVAMANMYRVVFPAQNQAKNINLLCKAVNMPGRQILSNERIVGISRQTVAYGFEKEQVTMTFNVLNDPFIRYYFQEWMNLVIDNTSYEVGYYSDYVKNISIQQLKKGADAVALSKLRTPKESATPQSKDVSLGSSNTANQVSEEVVYSCLLQDAYPVSITSVGYADTNSEPIEISVVFDYKNWVATTANPGEEPAITERVQTKTQLVGGNIGP